MTIVTRPELSRHLGKSIKQLERLQDLGMPVLTQGNKGTPYEYDLEECMEWYTEFESIEEQEARIKKEEREASNETDTGIRDLKMEKISVEIDILRDRRDERRRQLVRITPIVEVFEGQLSSVKAQFLQLPNKLAPLLGGTAEEEVELHKMITSHVDDILRELSADPVKKMIGDAKEDSETSQ